MNLLQFKTDCVFWKKINKTECNNSELYFVIAYKESGLNFNKHYGSEYFDFNFTVFKKVDGESYSAIASPNENFDVWPDDDEIDYSLLVEYFKDIPEFGVLPFKAEIVFLDNDEFDLSISLKISDESNVISANANMSDLDFMSEALSSIKFIRQISNNTGKNDIFSL